ncbi:MAG: L-threonylcarbamoyladenylate synthase, partial [Rhodoferax sp.]
MIVSAAAPDSIDRCAEALRAGALIGLPTETVYGLAADAANDRAVARIFVAKARPADHPLIVHVSA